MAGTILVFVERRDGEIKRPSLEAISVARRLADGCGASVDAVAIGPAASTLAEQLGGHGVDRLWTMDADHGASYAPELYAATVAQAAEQAGAVVVLAGATAQGKDLAPRAASHMKTVCASDLIEIEFNDGQLTGKRSIYSGRAVASIAVEGASVAFATLRPNAFEPGDGAASGSAQLQALEAPVAADALRVRAVSFEQSEGEEQDVTEASVVVSGGRGLKEAANFSLIRDLAGVLDGAVGASRAVVDAGWIDHSHQVGQTGKVVSPNLYIACGISGAVQHLAGMSSSKVIVAINKDPEAPIFKIADYGIVGDLFEVLPALTEAVRKLKSD